MGPVSMISGLGTDTQKVERRKVHNSAVAVRLASAPMTRMMAPRQVARTQQPLTAQQFLNSQKRVMHSCCITPNQ